MFDIVEKHWPMSEGDGKATRKKRPRILAITTDCCTGCSGSPACIEYCPIEACMFWVPDEDHPPFGRIEVDPYLCIGCQKCTSKGPMPGTARLATARPAVAPPAAPIAPPTAAPIARPMPGSSVSLTGTPASIRSGALPGLTIPILFSGIPRLLNCSTAFSACSCDLNNPVTACISVPPQLVSITFLKLVTFRSKQRTPPTQIVEEFRKAMLESKRDPTR